MSLLLVALPVCHKDVHLALANLDCCIEMDGKTRHEALLCVDSTFEHESEVLPKASQYFAHVTVFRYSDWRGNQEWPTPQNYAWQAVARHMACVAGKARGWLWWEADALPLKKGWLDTLCDAYVKSKKPFMGNVVEGRGYMNGVAIYPFVISHYSTNAFLVRDEPFDVTLSKSLKIGKPNSLVHPCNHLIHHWIKESGGDAPSEIDQSATAHLDAVLIHGATHALKEAPKLMQSVKEELPFRQQTKWECGLYELSGNTGTVYFNPSVITFSGTDYLFARRCRFLNPNHAKAALEGTNDLAIFDLSETPPKMLPAPAPPGRWPAEQWEDPRATVANGKVYVSFATWVHYREWKIRQSLTLLADDWKSFEVVSELDYGGNSPHPQAASANEKNWLWFHRGGQWHVIYLTNPLTVLTVIGGAIKSFRHSKVELPWQFGNPFGGTPPALIGNEYWSFFHSYTPWPWMGTRRRYYMGAITFTTDPWKISRITTKPLLSGSEHDPRVYGGPPCIFPCGALLRDGVWLVTFGVNDENCGWIKIPHSDLESNMKPL